MVAIAIALLWVLVGIVVLGAVIGLFLYYAHQFVTFPDIVDKFIWAVFVILAVIYAIKALAGGGGGGLPHPFR